VRGENNIIPARGTFRLIQFNYFNITERFFQNLRRYRSFAFQSVAPRQSGRKMAMEHYLIARLSSRSGRRASFQEGYGNMDKKGCPVSVASLVL